MPLGYPTSTYHDSTSLDIMPKALQKTKDPFLILTPAQASGDEFDFSVIRDSSIAKDALDAQKTARVLFELERAAPKLGQLGDILKGAVMGKSDIPRTTAFVEQLETLTIQLKRMIVNAQPPSKSENVVANSFIGQIDTLLSTPPRNTKRSSGAIT